MKKRVITNRFAGMHQRMSIPQNPVWDKQLELATGIDLTGLFTRRDGQVVARTYSYWEDRKTHSCVGERFSLVNEDNFEPPEVAYFLKMVESSKK